ncbi:NADP-dependent oxidoreductase [Amnibacterium kyonggiense]|uniref:NADPH:quinone reductase-like Zn-dependent oxidoreductase n=1 Tax=Amnibacterium kyonggiense TaxID=595671 RepID=A0A4R7FQT6_9MICO|nr:NADP-dependent oxidoreductase [Amnibacterium kyonggiense]TDS79979.1 NADPH:quinone reductase-like Zn-dependent oxidoreductase [Amnibacterium kyonggiense]
MQAIRFHAYGDPSVLQLEDVAKPTPREGEVLVRVAATSFNGIDAGIRGGGMQGPFPVALPHIPGIDVAGTVEALGDGVTGFEVGQRVVGFLPMVADGAAAEFAVAPTAVLTAAPERIPLADAAALPAVGLTAWQALFDHAGLRAGQRVLVNGAGGAVGAYAVQLAKRAGARVIATASARSRDRVLASGADEVVDHTTDALADAVTEPVDVVVQLAPIDPEAFAALVPLVADGGVIVSTTVWMPAPSDKARGVRGVDLFVRSDAVQLAELVALVDAGELRVDVAERVPLADLRSVHERAAAGGVSGKVVVLAPSA